MLLDMMKVGRQARAALNPLAACSGESRAQAILLAAQKVAEREADILAVNAEDCATASVHGHPDAFVDRMRLSPERLAGLREGMAVIANSPDIVGETLEQWDRPNGLTFERVRTPIGVVAMIYESRPGVTLDAASICLKAGNAVILRGGSDCLDTAGILFDCFAEALVEAGLPEHAAQLVRSTDRAAVGETLSGLDGGVDLIIPRGGKSLVARVQEEARAPVLAHLEGRCHVYVDADADPTMATSIIVNAKMRRPGVCGAAETLLLDRAVLGTHWPMIGAALREAGCEIRGDQALCAIDAEVIAATDQDWNTEYLAPILSVATVDGVDQAIAHIDRYGSGHTDAIVTDNAQTAKAFLSAVDSSIVMHNTSTQFADGGEFGFGGEIGIATGRLHARGPVGVRELTTYKTIVRGTGQTRPS